MGGISLNFANFCEKGKRLKGGHSLVWLEYWPVTPKVAGSIPVVLEKMWSSQDCYGEFLLFFHKNTKMLKAKSFSLGLNCSVFCEKEHCRFDPPFSLRREVDVFSIF